MENISQIFPIIPDLGPAVIPCVIPKTMYYDKDLSDNTTCFRQKACRNERKERFSTT